VAEVTGDVTGGTLQRVEPWRSAWERALYGPDGFFLREAPRDHFRTAATSPVFAAAVRRLAGLVDEALGRPDPFDVVDLGAGRAELLQALPGVPARWRLTAVERAPDPGLPGVRWRRDVPAVRGLLLAHEWLDAVPLDVVEDARRRWAGRGWRKAAQAPARTLTRGSLYAPSYDVTVRRDDGTEVGIADVLVPQQGPNYTLAKRLQRWRAVVAQADGVVVSANVAPATSTRSVTKNRLLAAAYAGARSFGVEVFEPATSRVLMAALLVHDLRAPAAAPAHPDDLFVQQAAHGGLWRIGYAPRSVLGLAAVRGLPGAVRR